MRNSSKFYKADEIAKVYKKKLLSTDEAAKLVKPGFRIHLGTFGNIARDFEAALAKRKDELSDIVLTTSLWSYDDTYETNKVDPDGEVFRLYSTHMSQKDRRMKTAGHAWYVPIIYNETEINWPQHGHIDIAVFMVAPMDRAGNFNLGITVGEMRGIVQCADVVIVEVNENMPSCPGMENYINLSEVDYVIESSNYALAELATREAGGADAKIAENIMPLLEDGSCLQLGIGAMPNHLGKLIAQSDLKDLSVHTEMMVDAFVDLYEEGKITGNKHRDPGKMVYTFALGTKRLYDFLDNNPVCMSAPVDYVNDPHIIAQNDKVISINSCLQIDLYGQVSAESIGFNHISGQGGQMNFVEGAYQSKGGKSFLCTASTKTKGENVESLILPFLPPGGIVSCPRYATHYVVTEYGVALLKNKSTWERAEALINIAHPDFREDLIKQAEAQGIWKNSSKLL
jgi:acyl-CoA hydrolase